MTNGKMTVSKSSKYLCIFALVTTLLVIFVAFRFREKEHASESPVVYDFVKSLPWHWLTPTPNLSLNPNAHIK